MGAIGKAIHVGQVVRRGKVHLILGNIDRAVVFALDTHVGKVVRLIATIAVLLVAASAIA